MPDWSRAIRSARDRLIVALDVSTATDARRIVLSVGKAAGSFKVGKQLFTAEGPAFVRELVAAGQRIFLDLKFHDIPNTVSGAVQEAARMGVKMLTVHAGGGSAMLRAAVEAAATSPDPPAVLAVTVLTSLTDADLAETGVSGRVPDQVLRLANLAQKAGCQGVVASAREAPRLRQELGPDLWIVAPGIRPAGEAASDQARVVTPAAAISAGVTYMVVGRPITKAADPGQAAEAIVAEIETSLERSPSPAIR